MEAIKRQRSENWLAEDKELLLTLVKNRVSVVENKNTDSNTNLKKKAAWADICENFKKLCRGSKRTEPQLRRQWGMAKIAAKKEKAKSRSEKTITGGGPFQSDVAVRTDDMSAWLPQEFALDFNNFDSDGPEIKYQDEDEKIGEKSAQPPQKKLKKTKNMEGAESISDKKIIEIAQTDKKCREEIHNIQMETEKRKLENEDKRSRNLDLEQEILQEQLRYYKRKNNQMDMRDGNFVM